MNGIRYENRKTEMRKNDQKQVTTSKQKNKKKIRNIFARV